MPSKIVKIEWDFPDDPDFIDADTVATGLGMIYEYTAFTSIDCDALLAACDAAMKWSAGFPLQGDASEWDREVADDVYGRCRAAIALVRGENGP